jgi:hypothetical protein
MEFDKHNSLNHAGAPAEIRRGPAAEGRALRGERLPDEPSPEPVTGTGSGAGRREKLANQSPDVCRAVASVIA